MIERYLKRHITDADSVEYFIEHGYTRGMAETLSSRGVTSSNFASFFDDNFFHSPFEMKNMQEAAETISFVLEQGGSVLIYGDYDTDGLTASSILSLFFTDNGVDNDVIIPSREDGYGLHYELVMKAYEKKFYDLIITVDCGIANREEVDKIIEELDAEIIVTDHHELPQQLPNCLCVNPKMGYPFPNLSGAGVAWKLVEALAGRTVAAKYSDLAMLGTVGDVMPMLDENRSIVKLGFANWNHKSLRKLATDAKCPNPPTVTDVSMKITPRINAASRMGSPQTALSLLLSRDKVDEKTISDLHKLNDNRKVAEKRIVEQAETMCDTAKIYDEHLVFLRGEDWNCGILGIVASRLKSKYGCVTVLMSRKENDVYTGSARGVEGVNLFEVFSQCGDLLDHFGGHKAAVGFSVSKENIELLHNRLAEILTHTECDRFKYYDMELDDSTTVADFYEFTKSLQPLLKEDKVVFRVKDSVKTLQKNEYITTFTLSEGLDLKYFYPSVDYSGYVKSGTNIDALVSLYYDTYSKKICGEVENLHICNSVCLDELYSCRYIRNLRINNADIVDSVATEKLLKEPSVLAVFDDYDTFLQESEKYCFDDFCVDIFFDSSEFPKTVAIAPNKDYNFDKYKNVICFTKQGGITTPKGVVCFVTPANDGLYNVDISREICAAVYSKLKHKTEFDSVQGVYRKYLLGSISYEQFLVALCVFEELNLIKIVDSYTVEFNTGNKVDLTQSSVFRWFTEQK